MESRARPVGGAMGGNAEELNQSAVQKLLAAFTPSRAAAPAVFGRTLKIIGALDKKIAPGIKAQAKAMVAEGGQLTLDLSEVRRWDAEGLAALVYALDVSELAGVQLTLLDPSPALRQTLELAHLHRMFLIRHGDE